MNYDVYFHNDFDGRASAAVMLAFLRSRGDDIEHFTPVNYHLLSQWLDENFFVRHKLFKGKRNPAIVVDFLYHPKAAFWFEHHPTTFKKERWKKNFKPDKFHHLDPQYPSCTHLVYAALKKDFGWRPPRHLADLVKWLDVIDGAQYRSAKQTIEMKEPALRVNEFIERRNHSAKENGWIVDALSRLPLAKIATDSKIKKAVAEIRKENALGIAFYRKQAVIEGKICIIDRTGVQLPFPHYVGSYLFPKVLYTVRISDRDGMYHVNVGLSPWHRKDSVVHIGKLLMPFKGGGHKDVGGVEFKTKKEALAAAQFFVEKIQKALARHGR